MADRNFIITLPNAALRKKSRRVHVITPEIVKIVDDMQTSTLDWEASRPHELGVALAAIQIDRPERIVIIRNDFDNKNDKSFTVLINPEVIKKEGEPSADHEGCLSVKDVYGMVPRYPKIRIKAMDLKGRDLRIKAEGFLARVLQHEIDHTNGIMFVDHIKGKKDAFFRLTEDGQLKKLDYDKVETTGIFR